MNESQLPDQEELRAAGIREAEPDPAHLLKEYEMCQSAAQSLEATIWQTGAVLGLSSIGTFILVASHPPREQPPWLVAAGIGALVSLSSVIWWRVARRWWSIQHTKYARMRHIEETLLLAQTRYIEYLDKPPGDAAAQSLKAKLIGKVATSDQLDELGEIDYQRGGPQKYLRFLPWAITVVWVIYVLWLSFPEFETYQISLPVIILMAWVGTFLWIWSK